MNIEVHSKSAPIMDHDEVLSLDKGNIPLKPFGATEPIDTSLEKFQALQ